MNVAKQHLINSNHFSFAAQEWGDPKGLPVIALHGWLDNSASFEPLASELSSIRLIDIDLAGHGHSDHRSGMADYSLLQDVADVIAIVNALDLDQFALLGHSRGAMVSFILAAAYPNRVIASLMLDALTPPYQEDAQAPERLVRSINTIARKQTRSNVRYDTLEKAILARCQSEYPISQEAAEYIVKRGIKEDQHGFFWSSDSKLFAPSLMALSRQQITAFADRIKAPMKLILASDGLNDRNSPSIYQSMIEFVDYLSIPTLTISGGHFFHMEQAHDVAKYAERFFINAIDISRLEFKDNAK